MNFLRYITIIVFSCLGISITQPTVFATARKAAVIPITADNHIETKELAGTHATAAHTVVADGPLRLHTWFASKQILMLKQKMLDVRYEKQFPDLAKKVDFFEFCDELLDHYEDMQSVSIHNALTWCPCTNAWSRIDLILHQLNDIIAQHRPTEKFTHLELGEAGCLQLYLLAHGLLKLGFKKLDLIAIGLSDDRFSHYGDLNIYGERLRQLLHKAAHDEKASVDISILCTKTAERYLEIIHNNPGDYQAQSFGMTDPAYQPSNRTQKKRAQLDDYKEIITKTKGSDNPIIYTLGQYYLSDQNTNRAKLRYTKIAVTEAVKVTKQAELLGRKRYFVNAMTCAFLFVGFMLFVKPQLFHKGYSQEMIKSMVGL